MTENDDEGGGSGTFGGVYRPDINDPDVCNALGAGVRHELLLLAKVCLLERLIYLFLETIQTCSPDC